MDVTDVLRDRMQEPGGLQGMASVSVIAHAAIVAALVLAPARWWSQHATELPKTVMTITLGGGAPGPVNGGMTMTGGRPVQTTEPPESARREAARPPAVATPEMTLPKPNTKPVKAPPTPLVKQAPEDARGRTPTRGAEASAGSAISETGVRGQGFGLSTGGGAGSGSYLDVASFCCPDYLVLMIERIRSNWNPRSEVPGESLLKFTIQRDGRIDDITLEKSSGYTALDLTAQRALAVTRQLPPLPAAFPNPTLTVHLNFQYQR
jgi:TonB family protein